MDWKFTKWLHIHASLEYYNLQNFAEWTSYKFYIGFTYGMFYCFLPMPKSYLLEFCALRCHGLSGSNIWYVPDSIIIILADAANVVLTYNLFVTQGYEK